MSEHQIKSRSGIPGDHRQRVLQVAKKVSATLGTDFFYSLTKHLVTAFRTDCVYVGELISVPGNRIRTLAVCRNGQEAENFDQDLSGTATGQVLGDGAFVCSRDAMRIFPLDTVLESISAETYVGIRLSDSAGQPLGVLAMICSRRRRDVLLERSVLETFASRAASELERKRSYDLLRESEQRYRAFISSNSDGMWRIELEQPLPIVLDEEEQVEWIYRFGYVAECNEAMARLIGAQTVEQVLGARFGDVAPRTDARMQNELRLAIRSEFRNTTVETTLLNSGGRRIYRLRSQFGIVEKGELRRIWVTTRDITDLRRAELSLQASERRFDQVLKSVQLPCVMLDESGMVTFCNDALLRLAGRSREELSGQNWFEAIVPAEERETWKAAFLPRIPGQSSGASHFEGAISPREGTPRLIAWDTVVLPDEDGEVASLAAIGRDITDQRALEVEIRRAQKLEVIGRLAGGIAHDFNNLLTIIMGHTAMLLEEMEKTDPEYETLAAIQDASERSAGLMHQLLAIGRKQVVHPQLISMNAVILADEGLIRSVAGEDIQLIIDLEPALGLVYADPSQIQRVVANLVTNARDATPRGGKLVIATSNFEIPESSTTYPADVKPGPYARLSVADTGTGLSEEVRTHLFEPFFTTKEAGRGTGLGLSVVHGIISQSGGYILVHSEPGKGTTFEILLPVVAG